MLNAERLPRLGSTIQICAPAPAWRSMKLASVARTSRSYSTSLPMIRSNCPCTALASKGALCGCSRCATKGVLPHCPVRYFIGGRALSRRFSSKNGLASGWQSLAVTSTPRRWHTRLASPRPQPISSTRSSLRKGRRAIRAASWAPEGHSRPNNGQVADEMPRRSATPRGSENCWRSRSERMSRLSTPAIGTLSCLVR